MSGNRKMKVVAVAGVALAAILSGAGVAQGQARSRAAEVAGRVSLERAEALEQEQRSFRTVAPAPWTQESAAARAYAGAREALNARKYRQAIDEFRGLRERYPASPYVADSYYWEAFALYREGGQDSYRRALELLAVQEAQHPEADTRADAEELTVRVESLLARRGDAAAAAQIARRAQEDPCGEQDAVRAAALNALLNMNPERAMPILREVLQRRDECSVELRRRAVFLISQTMTGESVDLLLDLAHRNPDPDPEVREQAVFWLSQVQGDQALDALEAILQESAEPEMQERAIFAISQHGSDRAAAILRGYAERADAPRELREQAILWLGQSGQVDYLISLYGRMDDPELKEQLLFGIAQGGSEESRAWLVERAMDPSEPTETRKDALFWAEQMGGLGMDELDRLYRTLSDPELREQVIFVAGQSGEAGSVDFLMGVARDDEDPELREQAIFWLGQNDDPRVAEFLLSLIR
ncbi:MAG: HEAT repeat domain-containing protein [Gemmatimonadota bacterium]